LEGALEAASQGRVIAATDTLIEHLNGLFLAGEIEMARRLLARIDPERLPPKVLSSVLMVTKAAKAALGEERTKFFERWTWRRGKRAGHPSGERKTRRRRDSS
jgi:hypothetical protein